MGKRSYLFETEPITKGDIELFRRELVVSLGLDGGEVDEDRLVSFLRTSFGDERTNQIRALASKDLSFFRDCDPASTSYSEIQILSVRRGMAAIFAHRLFQEVLGRFPGLLYEMEFIAKYVQKDTNVEIHPLATIGVPFAIDHGHGTVIGATGVIGNGVFIYHGVTLGATGKRSRTGRRHPIVGDNVFFGNGSQVLGPSIIERDTTIASDAVVADSYVHADAKLFLNVRVAGVIVPAGARIFAGDPENGRRFWAQLEGEDAPRWAEFAKFNPADFD